MMQLLIDITENEYKYLTKLVENNDILGHYERMIMRGLPLPEHGDLVDVDELKKHLHHTGYYIDIHQTIDEEANVIIPSNKTEMIQVITAPDDAVAIYPSVFLAGGITNCKPWQDMVIKELKDYKESDAVQMSIFNPRQANFDIYNKRAANDQIAWEFYRLEKMEIFSMYFCEGESDQPICMYELGRNIVMMQNRYPNDWVERIIVSIEDGYKREQDVIKQLHLCAPNVNIIQYADPEEHALAIRSTVQHLIDIGAIHNYR